MAQFVERRKQHRLPFEDKVIFTEGSKSFTAYASNISRGGVFVTSTNPFPLETIGHLAFFLPGQEHCLCFKAKVAHVVFDRQRCEVENGMGFMFQDMSEAQQSLLDRHLEKEQAAYMELKLILAAENPNASEIARCLSALPNLRRHDLLALRYKVNRICTLFENTPESIAGSNLQQSA